MLESSQIHRVGMPTGSSNSGERIQLKRYAEKQRYVLDHSLNDNVHNATDYARGTTPAHCFAPCTPDRVKGAREYVMNLFVDTIRLPMRSTDLAFSEDDRGSQLSPRSV